MKQKTLLFIAATVLAAGADAQKKSKPVTAYAITAAEKGNHRWTEVKLIDVSTGEEIKSIYNSSDKAKAYNARTGKEIEVKDIRVKEMKSSPSHEVIIIKDGKIISENNGTITLNADQLKRITGKVREIRVEGKAIESGSLRSGERIENGHGTHVKVIRRVAVKMDAPFATNSAALAFDKKHDRLYYTPMGINQLRYIDLKSGKTFYFENEPFGALSGPGDVPNQITRMVIGEGGNGYALTNNGEHLIKFSTDKKAKVTDLGPLTDDAGNGNYSIHSRNGYGGDMVADNDGNLYMLTANRAVFKINIENKVAKYLGTIKGLPRGFSTNGAVAEKGSNIIVTSSTSTEGYFNVDLNTLQAKKISSGGEAFNASDLANGNLISAKKVKEEKEQEIVKADIEENLVDSQEKEIEIIQQNSISVYPNPVTNGLVNINFSVFENGRYEIQLFDLNGKMLQVQSVTINGKSQIQEIRLPSTLAKGSYLVKVTGDGGRIVNSEKIIVQ